jgi:hypothetical protein
VVTKLGPTQEDEERAASPEPLRESVPENADPSLMVTDIAVRRVPAGESCGGKPNEGLNVTSIGIGPVVGPAEG